MGKKIIDADYEIVTDRGGRKPDARAHVRKELPGWFKVLMFGLVALTFLGVGLERAKQKSGLPSLLDDPTAPAEAAR